MRRHSIDLKLRQRRLLIQPAVTGSARRLEFSTCIQLCCSFNSAQPPPPILLQHPPPPPRSPFAIQIMRLQSIYNIRYIPSQLVITRRPFEMGEVSTSPEVQRPYSAPRGAAIGYDGANGCHFKVLDVPKY